MPRVAAALLTVFWGAAAVEVQNNPIRKVVTMLQEMQKSVTVAGEKEKELFEKFMCYCSTSSGNLDTAIQTGSAQIETLTGKIEGQSAERSQLDQDLAQHKTDRADAENTIKKSQAMRAKEAADFAASSGSMQGDIGAMSAALDALKQGLPASFLQTSVGQTLKNILEHSPAISEDDRSGMLSFLENGEGGSSDQIIGVVEQMKETMESDLKQSSADEKEAQARFASLMASKQQEVDAARTAIESKSMRVGDVMVSVAQSKADLEDTQGALGEDQKFKANLGDTCATKSKEEDERANTNAQEIQALSETIEMLNGDDALELFKKTLPSPAPVSFLQAKATSRMHQRGDAAGILRGLVARSPQSLNLKAILLQTQGGGLGSVVKMIDRMIAEHAADQADDDSKRDFCNAEFAKTQEAQKALNGVVGDLKADISHKQDTVAAFASEIATLQQGIADLDKSVVQATQQRRMEHGEYTTTASSNQAALELVRMAKNRMNKFYQPSLYKAPPVTTMGPYGFTQLTLLSRARAQHESSASGKANGVIALLDQIIKDIELSIQEAKHDEKVAQRDYERTMKDAATKRLDDSKLMVEKQAAKADEQVELETVSEHLATKNNQLALAKRKMRDLHIDCDNLLQKYDELKSDRAAEVEGLQQSKSVLQGSEQAPVAAAAAPIVPAEEPANGQSEAALESAMMAPAADGTAASEPAAAAAAAASAAVADAATDAAAELQ